MSIIVILTKGGYFVKIIFVKEIIHSTKKDKDFYVVRYALVDESKNIIAKSEPIFWLSKENYDLLNI